MESKYVTLKAIYEIVMNEASPFTYACFPNEIIIRQTQPWDIIIKQLDELATEELITIQQPGTTIYITAKGMEKATADMIVL